MLKYYTISECPGSRKMRTLCAGPGSDSLQFLGSWWGGTWPSSGLPSVTAVQSLRLFAAAHVPALLAYPLAQGTALLMQARGVGGVSKGGGGGEGGSGCLQPHLAITTFFSHVIGCSQGE